MKYDKTQKYLTVDEALVLIKNNTERCFNWYPVKNKFHIMEVGGNYQEVKANIPYHNGDLSLYDNGYIKPEFILNSKQDSIHTNVSTGTKNSVGGFAMDIRDILKKDLRNLVIEEKEVAYTEYKTVYKVKFKTKNN